ncbi:hypothetical protein NBRC116583_06110 [Arenicella sp. 4NH20-0111]|uniref:hypothetical protein n=1 Tax=Arenicella sp. 4NH20-0111 TaxID=3127648 RepID=UPI00310731C9
MFLESLTGANRRELESLCKELTADLKKKQNELDRKEKQIHRLAKNNRRWTRKYHELEQSISENTIDVSDAVDSERDQQTKNLQLMLIKLNRKNGKLEKRVQALSSKLEKSRVETRGDSGSTSIADANQPISGFKAIDPEVEPEFPPEFQKVLDRYAASTETES